MVFVDVCVHLCLVCVEPTAKKMGRAKVVFSYTPTCDDELTLEVDAIVDVTAQVGILPSGQCYAVVTVETFCVFH